ncbi:MAG: hypothetical protein J0L55_00920 [Caulobacterales bacterium]|nr:hypothetical protein [Caulobacterales bacterium]MCA0373735.1 hypothetical protein [Pseudomonadota bacterium]
MSQNHQALTDKVRIQSIELLNQNLANAIDLHAQLKTAFWNVQITGLINIKRLLDINSKSALEFEDLIAERISALGGHVFGNIQFSSNNSVLIPYEIGVCPEIEHGFAVSASLAAYSQAVSSAIAASTKIHDFTTAEVFSNILKITDAALRRLSLHLDAHCPIPFTDDENAAPVKHFEKYAKLEKLI